MLTELLQNKKVLLADGAWGTEFIKNGLRPGESPEMFNLEKPDIVSGVASSYVKAGSDIIITNTFGGSPYKLASDGADDRVEDINEAGARLSVESAAGNAAVFASIGPTGQFLAPLGRETEENMIAAFARQVAGFKKAGVDGVVVETMTDINEISCALRAVKDNSDLPVICSMTFDSGLNGYATMMGVRPSDAVKTLQKNGADAVGANCGSGIDEMIDIAKLMRPETDLPLWFKPNAGKPELVDGETVFRETPEIMGDGIPALIEAGATIVGGCCGTTPVHIAYFRKIIDSL